MKLKPIDTEYKVTMDSASAVERNLIKQMETELEAKVGNKAKSFTLNMDVYTRQNSVNEVKEETGDKSPVPGLSGECYDLKDKPSGKVDPQCCELKDKNSAKIHTFSRQPSESPLVPKNHSAVVNVGDFSSKDSRWSTDLDKGQGGKRQTCCFIIQTFSFLLTVTTLGLVAFLYYKVKHSEAGYIPEVIIGQSHRDSALVNDEGVSGSFKLDQYYLRDNRKIRWLADEASGIKSDADGPCLIVPVAGKYLVISRFTFNLPPGDDKTLLTHQIFLKSAGVETVIKRQYLSVIEHKLKEDSELRKPSVFTQFFYLMAGDEVCTSVSNPELLYLSPIDNDVNILKV